MKRANPYSSAPDYRRWSKSVAAKGAAADPLVRWPYQIKRTDRIATAGSCFAQHIARYLQRSGYNFLQCEPAHPILSPEIAETFGYTQYSARFGNIYSARQLLQLFQRAFGQFEPEEPVWKSADGRYFDPLRPSIQPRGFATLAEFNADRRQHMAAVRKMFEDLDIFVFTLGLTETWVSAIDGTAFPVCPGTVAGEFDPERHVYLNFSTSDVIADLEAFIAGLRLINPRARIILSVSPVPLAATAEDRSVLVSTVYSKSVLRCAAEQVSALDSVDYFPSYEIITGPQSRGRFFADDLRSVTEDGVAQVMSVFFRHVAGEPFLERSEPAKADEFNDTLQAVVDALCDEAALDAAADAVLQENNPR